MKGNSKRKCNYNIPTGDTLALRDEQLRTGSHRTLSVFFTFSQPKICFCKANGELLLGESSPFAVRWLTFCNAIIITLSVRYLQLQTKTVTLSCFFTELSRSLRPHNRLSCVSLSHRYLRCQACRVCSRPPSPDPPGCHMPSD